MTFHPRSVNYWNIFFERFTQKAIWWNSCKNQQQPCRRPSPDTFRLDEDSERDLTVQVSLGDCYNTYMKIHSDTIISVNFCSNYKSELFISYSFGECKIICTVCAHNSYSYVLHYCYYFPLVTHAKFTFICTVFHRIFYRPGRDSITDMWLYYFYPFWFDKHVVPCINLCSISKSHHLMKKIWSFSVPL